MGAERARVSDQLLCYYYARAVGGVGLVIVELTFVTGRFALPPGMGISIVSDRNIPGLQDLARVIHWGGAKAIIQLTPGQGAQTFKHHPKFPLIGPSDVAALVQKEDLPKAIQGFLKKAPERPRPLTVEEIGELKTAMVQGAVRAKKAGFDGMEIHGAHGYLLCQFTSPYFNQRNDQYGGSPENRWRFPTELVREIKEEAGKDFVVGYRFSAKEWIPGGLDLPESTQMAKAIEEAGADYLSVSQGCYGSAMRIFPKGDGTITELAAKIKEEVSVPVMAPNFHDPDRAAEAISKGSVDMVALSRALLADAHWVEKVREGQPESIRKCIRCYQCVQAAVVDHAPIRCAVNPVLGFERFDPRYLPRPEGAREIML
jgi:2,4-dienoyl-CoA reductase-like NADH-dependent reductase (Old Yellow Enzyme family)